MGNQVFNVGENHYIASINESCFPKNLSLVKQHFPPLKAESSRSLNQDGPTSRRLTANRQSTVEESKSHPVCLSPQSSFQPQTRIKEKGRLGDSGKKTLPISPRTNPFLKLRTVSGKKGGDMS
ncbi:hypothetical protein V6N13_010160 [Hibiscus sabdariffa]|uniref:Uncharacterized protein n=1 Tax=Hibiscus sabdariffa TaxID=183260 RepID=A0ABR2PQW8_9ROSI